MERTTQINEIRFKIFLLEIELQKSKITSTSNSNGAKIGTSKSKNTRTSLSVERFADMGVKNRRELKKLKVLEKSRIFNMFRQIHRRPVTIIVKIHRRPMTRII